MSADTKNESEKVSRWQQCLILWSQVATGPLVMSLNKSADLWRRDGVR